MDQVRELFWSAFNRKIFAHDVETGFEVWEYEMSSGAGISASIIVDGQLLFVASHGYVYALEAQTGREVWKNPMKGKGISLGHLALSRARPESLDDPTHRLADLLWVAMGAHVCALWRLNGEVVWEYKLGEGMGFFVSPHWTHIALDGDRLVAATNGHLYAFDAVSGQLLWTNPMKGKGIGITAIAALHESELDPEVV